MHRNSVDGYRERILRAVVELEASLGRRPSLTSLASRAFLSPFHFHRVFRAVVGEAPGEYARRLRLEHAARELAATSRSIASVGRDLGYRRPESFTRAFQAQFGLTPRDFRAAQDGTWTPARAGAASSPDRIEVFAPLRVAFIRHVGPYEQVPPVFARIAAWIGEQPNRRADPLFIGVAHDDPSVTPADLLRFDCCVAVPDDVRGQGVIGIQRILGGSYAVALHTGPFTTIHETYARLALDVIPAFGVTVRASAAVELYVTPPGATPPDEQITEVLLPVRSNP